MQTIYLDISNKGVIPTIYAKQGDVGRKFLAVITEAGLQYVIPTGATVSVWYQNLKDTNAGNADGVSVNENSVEVTLASKITAVSGDGILCLTISYENGDQISTWNIPYSVEVKPGTQPIEPSSPIWNQKSVLYTEQKLTEEQRRQARLNINALGMGEETPLPDGILFFTEQLLSEDAKEQARENIGALPYYRTEREEISVSHENINAEYIWGLYDALMAEYPGKVQKNPIYNDDGTFTNYEYVISTGEYNTEGFYGEHYGQDGHIKKPKYLVLDAIHGTERKTTFSTHRFISDVLSGHNVPQAFKESVVISVIPVANPSGFDSFTYANGNQVNINRNFDHDGEWVEETGYGYDKNGNVIETYTNGKSAASEKETQVIKKWLQDNQDADLLIDFHNSSVVNEVVAILGLPNNDVTDVTKKIALQGVDCVIPYWRDVIQWPEGTIFSYSASVPAEVKGSGIAYAQNELGIPSIAIETSTYYGSKDEWWDNQNVYQPELIAAGAEALGNILIEFYKQAFFGEVSNEMKEIDNKLKRLEENIASMSRGFRTESGVMVVDADVLPADGAASITVKIPCSNGAKMFTFCADSETMTAISNEYKQTSPKSYVGSVLGNCFEPGVTYYGGTPRSYMSMMAYYEAMSSYHKGWVVGDWATTANNTDGATFVCKALKGGEISTGKNATYHWTAYYWND